MQFLLTFFWGEGGEEQEASALLSKKKGGGRGQSQQKFGVFSYDNTPKIYVFHIRLFHTAIHQEISSEMMSQCHKPIQIFYDFQMYCYILSHKFTACSLHSIVYN